MYQALIIDDEKHVRQTISLLGRWAENDIGNPLEATDGESALKILQETNIDIVLVDIKMPVMDGMQFLKIATARFPKIKYIIISGFNDFEYAKQAIQYQILDYLLKPISETELNHCLEKAVSELQKEQALNNEMPLPDLFNCLCRTADVPALGAILAIRVGGNSLTVWNEERSRLFLSQLLSHAALKENYHCYIESPHLLILGVEVLNSPFINFSKSYVEAKIQENVRNILNMFQKSHDFFTVAGMGQFVEPNITALKASYEQAVLISSKLNLYSSETLISHEYTAKSLSHLDYLSPKKELIMRALGKWDEKNLCRILNQHFSAILEKDHVTLELLSYNAMELLIIFQEFSREYQIPQYQELLAPLADLKELKEINSIKEFNDFFCSLFAQLGAYAQRNTQPTILNILSEIKSCIEEEYSRNLTLTYFSEKYHLTKEYLSKQFKEQYAYSIYEYLLSYRMEKAKELLSATDMKIQSVSDHVGYTDTNYFSKAFKTYCGISPREYRQQFGKSITKF